MSEPSSNPTPSAPATTPARARAAALFDPLLPKADQAACPSASDPAAAAPHPAAPGTDPAAAAHPAAAPHPAPAPTLHGFAVERRETIPELDADAYVLRHAASGARLLYLACEDENKAFAIGFKTPPTDSTGVFHILEHSVLCGSAKFPVKEPFVDLIKSSMQTFLNAMTYPDKTVYPVASTNEQDLLNLMDVYMDAVLNPAIYTKPTIFQQEGWHFELDVPEGAELTDPTCRLRYNGVVFNEMKGALSDPSSVLEDAVDASLFPDTAYACESGGDPRHIPELTYQHFLDTHARHYNLANSYITLYGDLDADRVLAFLDDRYLGDEPRARDAAARRAAAPDPVELDEAIAAGPNELRAQEPTVCDYKRVDMDTTPDNALVGIAYVLGGKGALDRKRVTGADVLFEALFGSNEAPVKKAILAAGLGGNVVSYTQAACLQPYELIMLQSAKPGVARKLQQVIEDECRRLVEEGVPRDRLEAVISSNEFDLRQRDYGTADGVVLACDALSTWLYDDDAATLALTYGPVFAELRRELDGTYFEDLLREVVLESDHHALVDLVPTTGATPVIPSEGGVAVDAPSVIPSEGGVAAAVEGSHPLAGDPSTPGAPAPSAQDDATVAAVAAAATPVTPNEVGAAAAAVPVIPNGTSNVIPSEGGEAAEAEGSPASSWDEAAELESIRASMTPAQLQGIVDDVARLRAVQEAEDTPEAKATLPRLHVSDIGPARPEPALTVDTTTPLTCLKHDIPTHKLAYAIEYFDLTHVSFAELPYVSVLASLLTQLATKRRSAAELDSYVTSNLGFLSFSTTVFTQPNWKLARPMLQVSAGALSEKLDNLVTIPQEVWAETIFEDVDRIRDVLMQVKIGAEQSFLNAGHQAALARAMSYVSPGAVTSQQLSGVDFYKFLRDLLDHFDERRDDLIARLRDLQARIFTSSGTVVSFTGSDEDYKRFWSKAGTLGLSPRTARAKELMVPWPEPKSEAFVIPSDVCFAARATDPRALGMETNGVWSLSSQVLTYDYLWNEIRVKGGAYGCGFRAMPDRQLAFYTYRDPAIDPSQERIAKAGEWLASFEPDQDAFEGFIVSWTAGADAPLKPYALAKRQDSEYFNKRTAGWREEMRREVLAATPADLRALGAEVTRAAKEAPLCVFGGRDIIEASDLDLNVVDLLG